MDPSGDNHDSVSNADDSDDAAITENNNDDEGKKSDLNDQSCGNDNENSENQDKDDVPEQGEGASSCPQPTADSESQDAAPCTKAASENGAHCSNYSSIDAAPAHCSIYSSEVAANCSHFLPEDPATIADAVASGCSDSVAGYSKTSVGVVSGYVCQNLEARSGEYVIHNVIKPSNSIISDDSNTISDIGLQDIEVKKYSKKSRYADSDQEITVYSSTSSEQDEALPSPAVTQLPKSRESEANRESFKIKCKRDSAKSKSGLSDWLKVQSAKYTHIQEVLLCDEYDSFSNSDQEELMYLIFKQREYDSKSYSITKVCTICLELRSSHLGHLTPCCNKYVCDLCMAMYVRTKISNHELKILCPQRGCQFILARDDIILYSDIRTRKKYERFLIDANNDPRKKTCPHCCKVTDNPASGLKFKSFFKKVPLRCSGCQLEWCFACHAPWHEGMTCRQFKQGEKPLDNWAKRLQIKNGWRNAVRCPNCKIYIEKIDGCSNMYCGRCNKGFCYDCGKAFRYIRFIGDHHDKYSVLGCKKIFFQDKPALRACIRGSILGLKIMTLPFVGSVLVVGGAVLVGTAALWAPVLGTVIFVKAMKRRRKDRDRARARREQKRWETLRRHERAYLYELQLRTMVARSPTVSARDSNRVVISHDTPQPGAEGDLDNRSVTLYHVDSLCFDVESDLENSGSSDFSDILVENENIEVLEKISISAAGDGNLTDCGNDLSISEVTICECGVVDAEKMAETDFDMYLQTQIQVNDNEDTYINANEEIICCESDMLCPERGVAEPDNENCVTIELEMPESSELVNLYSATTEL